jgi:hypothetical protein
VAFDARYELLDAQQVATIGRFQSRAGNWQRAIAGYSVVVLSKQHDEAIASALLRSGALRKAAVDGDMIVLRR